MKSSMKKLVTLLLVVAMITMFMAPMTVSFAAEPEIVKIAFTDAPTLKIGDMTIYHPSYAAMLAFKGAFEKYTAGRYKVELYPFGSLGDAASNLEQMLSGSLQGGTPADGALAPFYANIQVFSIPYLFDSALTAYDVLDGEFGQKLFDDMAAKSGLRVIASYDNGGYRNFSNSKRPIKTAADMKGLKIRTMDIPVHMEIVKALGASPTPIAFLELYSALQTSVVDGQENSAITMLGASLDEVQKYVTLDGHLLGMAFLTMSEKWFKTLSPEDQEACLRAGREASTAARGTVRYGESLAIETLKKSGVEVYTPTAEEMETFKIAQEPAINWLKSNIDAKLVDDLLSTVKSGKVGGGRVAFASAASPTASPSSSAAPATTAPSDSKTEAPANNNTTLFIVLGVIAVLIVGFVLFRKNKKQ
jgi:tripartite ATP-independent transporter DctP family solute receptor